MGAWEAFHVTEKPMRKATLTRYETGPEGTYSNVVTDNGYQCYGMELPWLDNKTGVSCAPAGSFLFKVADSPKHGKVYQEWDDPKTKEKEDVPGREFIQIHRANWIRQLRGCIALGGAVGIVLGIKGVMSSEDTVNRFMADLDGEPFLLTIKWESHLEPK